MLRSKAIVLFSAFTYNFLVWPSTWFIVCPRRKAVYLLETLVVLLGAQWFSSLIRVYLLVLLFWIFSLTLYCYAVALLLAILLIYLFPHIALLYLALFSLLKVPSRIKILIFFVFFLLPPPMDSPLIPICCYHTYQNHTHNQNHHQSQDAMAGHHHFRHSHAHHCCQGNHTNHHIC